MIVTQVQIFELDFIKQKLDEIFHTKQNENLVKEPVSGVHLRR